MSQDHFENRKQLFGDDYLLLSGEKPPISVGIKEVEENISPISVDKDDIVVITGSSRKIQLLSDLGVCSSIPFRADEPMDLGISRELNIWKGLPVLDEYLANMLPGKSRAPEYFRDKTYRVGTDTTVLLLLEGRDGWRTHSDYIDTVDNNRKRAALLVNRMKLGAKFYCIHALHIRAEEPDVNMSVIVAMRYDFSNEEIEFMSLVLNNPENKLPVGINLADSEYSGKIRSVHIAFNGFLGNEIYRALYKVKEEDIPAFASLPAGFGGISLKLLGA